MITAVWSVKGGVGVTSVAAMLAIARVERADDTLVVDLCGDMAAVLGIDEAPEQPGLVDWCALGRSDGAALARIEHVVRPGLHLVPRGSGRLAGDPAELVRVLATSQRAVIVDCGVVTDHQGFGAQVVALAPVSLLVVRECFLNLRAAQRAELEPTGVVVVKEPRRHLGRGDVESVTGAPVVAEVALDHSIARSIDAGLLSTRLPRSLLRTMSRAFDHVA